MKLDAIPSIFGLFLKKPDIEKDNTNNNVHETASIENNECTNEQAINDSENEEVRNDILSEPITSSVITPYVTEVSKNEKKKRKCIQK